MLSDKSTIDKTIGGNLHHAGCRLLILTNYLSTIQKMYQYISSISRADALDVVCCFNLGAYFNLMMFRELAGISTVAPFFSVVT